MPKRKDPPTERPRETMPAGPEEPPTEWTPQPVTEESDDA